MRHTEYDMHELPPKRVSCFPFILRLVLKFDIVTHNIESIGLVIVTARTSILVSQDMNVKELRLGAILYEACVYLNMTCEKEKYERDMIHDVMGGGSRSAAAARFRLLLPPTAKAVIMDWTTEYFNN